MRTIPPHRFAAGLLPTLVVGVIALIAAAPTGAGTPTLNLTLSGSAKGNPLKGKVQFARVMCSPTSGQGLLVLWNGSVQVKPRTYTNVNGELSYTKFGKSSFGTKSGSSSASLVVNNDYGHRFGSGLPGGSGTGTVARNHKAGSVGVVVVSGKDKVRIQGTWACG